MEKHHFTDIPPNQLPRTDGEVRVYKLSDDIINKYKKKFYDCARSSQKSFRNQKATAKSE